MKSGFKVAMGWLGFMTVGSVCKFTRPGILVG